MSKVDEQLMEEIFKAVQAFPNDIRIASLTQDCKAIVKDLERQLAEVREEIKDLHDSKNRMFSMMQMAYVDHEASKPLFKAMCNMIKEEIKKEGK